ncbi:hypothetical protein Q5752_003939 [Cryptotrichosporon argae]
MMNHRTAAQRVARHPDILPLIAAYLGNPELRNLSCADRQTFEVASAKLWSTVPYAVAASIDGETARGRLYAAAVRHVIVSHTIEEVLIHINTAHAEQPQLQLPGDWTGFDFVWNVELFASTPSESRARMRDDVIHVAKALEGRATIISLGLCNSQLTLDGISNLLDEVTVAAASARITELDDGAAEGWNLSQLRFFAARHGAALTSFRLESHAYTSNRDEVALSELADAVAFVRFLQTMPAAQFADFAAWHDRTTPAERASMGYDHAGLFRHARFGDDGHLLPRTGFEDASIQA